MREALGMGPVTKEDRAAWLRQAKQLERDLVDLRKRGKHSMVKDLETTIKALRDAAKA